MSERITNVHGEPSRFIEGQATSQTFLDLGPAGNRGYLQAEVLVDDEFPGHVTLRVWDFSNDLRPDELPRVRLVIQGNTYADLPVYPNGV